jgi:hypothetical protein
MFVGRLRGLIHETSDLIVKRGCMDPSLVPRVTSVQESVNPHRFVVHGIRVPIANERRTRDLAGEGE